ncbi:hypothetical protein OC844_002844 [Tilletia horrida]|nr:hypothetical protein OC844_002844 [Tilletia horrida]
MSRPASGAGPTPNAGTRGGSSGNGTAAAAAATAAGSAGGSSSSSGGQATAALSDLTPLLGTTLKLTLASGGTATGKLFAFDPNLGTVALETELTAAPAYLAGTIAGGAGNLKKAAAAQGADAGSRRTGFRLIKIREVKKVEVIPSSAPNGSAGADAVGAATGPDGLTALHALNVAAVDARANTAIRDAHLRASRRGVGVSAQAQGIFDALSKTLPCRWHGTHIIVLDEVVISGPAYDGSSTNVPSFTQDQLRAALDGQPLPPSADGSALSAQAQNTIRAKAASWQRVVKVLEGERAKIQRQEGAAAAVAAAS